MNIDLHHLIKCDAVLAPIIELRGARGGVCRHLARLLERAAVLEVGRDAGAAEGVVANLGGDVGGLGASAHHSPSVGSMQSLAVEDRLSTAVGAVPDDPSARS